MQFRGCEISRSLLQLNLTDSCCHHNREFLMATYNNVNNLCNVFNVQKWQKDIQKHCSVDMCYTEYCNAGSVCE